MDAALTGGDPTILRRLALIELGLADILVAVGYRPSAVSCGRTASGAWWTRHAESSALCELPWSCMQLRVLNVIPVALLDSRRIWDLFRPGLHAGVRLTALS